MKSALLFLLSLAVVSSSCTNQAEIDKQKEIARLQKEVSMLLNKLEAKNLMFKEEEPFLALEKESIMNIEDPKIKASKLRELANRLLQKADELKVLQDELSKKQRELDSLQKTE